MAEPSTKPLRGSFGKPNGLAARAALAVSPSLGGCAKSPSLNVVGAYFPDWMFCIIAGVVLAIVCHLVLQRTASGYWLGPPALAYPALVAIFSVVTWLIFFRH
jgi:hypothetical protein